MTSEMIGSCRCPCCRLRRLSELDNFYREEHESLLASMERASSREETKHLQVALDLNNEAIERVAAVALQVAAERGGPQGLEEAARR